MTDTTMHESRIAELEAEIAAIRQRIVRDKRAVAYAEAQLDEAEDTLRGSLAELDDADEELAALRDGGAA